MTILQIDIERYGSKEMRYIYEDERRLHSQPDCEVIVAQVESQLGLILAYAADANKSEDSPANVNATRDTELEPESEHE